jgi:hypothetical protein
VLTCIRGTWVVTAADAHMSLSIGETLVLPAGAEAELTAFGHGAVLRGWVPDLERDITKPARAARATDNRIRGLAGTPHDLTTGKA